MKRIISSLIICLVLSGLPLFSQVIDTAGTSTTDPGFTYGNYGKDIVNGTTYYFLRNDSAFVSISSVDVNNNQQGGLHKGVPMDIIHQRKLKDNLDWTQVVLSPTILSGWDYAAYNVDMSTIWINNNPNSINAYGPWNSDPNIAVMASYSLLPGSPVLKIKLKVYNNSSAGFNGYLMYEVDPDETGEQYAFVPGIGWGTTLVSGGWTKNYIYNGVNQGLHSGNPAHGIAWFKNAPEALISPGYIFGAVFKVNLPAGDTTSITLYHITDIPDNLNDSNYQCIERWADTIVYIDPELSSYSKISGQVRDINNNAVPHMPIKIKDIYGNIHGKIGTDSLGKYEVFLEKGLYTFTISGIGYYIQSRSIDTHLDSVLDFTNAFNAALQPVTVWAGFGKTLSAGNIQGTETDIIMENNQLVMSVASSSTDPQLPYSSKARPLDLTAHGIDDDLDWIHLSFASKVKPTGTTAWAYESVRYDTIYTTQLNPGIAVVKADGHYFELQGVNLDSVVIFSELPVTTTYTIEPGNKYILAETKMYNNSSQPQSFWIGDVIDHDGSGQTSYVPGAGVITAPYSSPAAYQPTAPWMAMYGSSSQAYGLIYEGDFANHFTAYGNGQWILSLDSVSIISGGSYQYNRYIVAANTSGFANKSDAIQDVYNEILGQQTGITAALSLSKTKINLNDTLMASLKISNSLAVSSSPIEISIQLPGQLSAAGPANITIVSIPANSDTLVNWILQGITGGRGLVRFTVTDTGSNAIVKTENVFVDAAGWYAGDNHMHTTYSDGSGSVADNVAAAYQRGLSWVTITDHNTINHKNDVLAEDAKYDDFLAMWGQEVSTSPSHFLAYNITKLKPWNNTLYTYQQLLDSVLDDNNGQGIAYIAHPYYPGLPWNDWSVQGYHGIEVWNGFYHATHSVNTQAFAVWDSLNRQGRHLYGIANSDAHNPGKIGDPHIVAWLDSLSKAEVYKAFNTGRLYGTNGPLLSFTIDGKPMGSDLIIPQGGRQVSISLKGSADQGITIVRLLRNGLLLKTWTPANDSFDLQHIDYANVNDFYRMEFEAGNGFAFSNPIWAAEGSSNALLTMISINNVPLPGFQDTILNYSVLLPQGTTVIPVVSATLADTNATAVITQAQNLNGTLSERTALITVTAEDGVAVKEYRIAFTIAQGIEEPATANRVTIYPLPAHSVVYLEFAIIPEKATYELLNANGQVVLSGKLASRINAIDLSNIRSGSYLIKIFSDGRYIASGKVIKG